MAYTYGSAHQVIKNTHLKNSKNKQTRNHSNLITQDCSKATSNYSHREALIHSPPPWVWHEGKSSSPCRRLLLQFFFEPKISSGLSCKNPRAPFLFDRKETQPKVTHGLPGSGGNHPSKPCCPPNPSDPGDNFVTSTPHVVFQLLKTPFCIISR